MIGYIVVVHYYFEDTFQVDDSPSQVYLDRAEAEREAEKHTNRSARSTGLVWEVVLPRMSFDLVLGQLLSHGIITCAQYDEAMA